MRQLSLKRIRERANSFRGSLIRAAIFLLSWLFLPSWLFVIVALCLYFFPIAQTGTVLWPFIGLLVLCLFQPTGFLFAVIFGVIFFFILLIKELMLIDRKSAYEIVMLVIMFLILRIFYQGLGDDFANGGLLYALALAALFGFCLASFMNTFSRTKGERHSIARTATFLSFFLAWEFIIVGLFLPLDYIYQSAVVFIILAFIVEVIPSYIFGILTRRKLLLTASVVFALLVLVLGSARWSL